MDNKRLAVCAHFLDKEARGNTSQSTIAFGWKDAQAMASQMRESIQHQYGVKCRIKIVPDEPKFDRRKNHWI